MHFENFKGQKRTKPEISLVQFVDELIEKKKQQSNNAISSLTSLSVTQQIQLARSKAMGHIPGGNVKMSTKSDTPQDSSIKQDFAQPSVISENIQPVVETPPVDTVGAPSQAGSVSSSTIKLESTSSTKNVPLDKVIPSTTSSTATLPSSTKEFTVREDSSDTIDTDTNVETITGRIKKKARTGGATSSSFDFLYGGDKVAKGAIKEPEEISEKYLPEGLLSSESFNTMDIYKDAVTNKIIPFKEFVLNNFGLPIQTIMPGVVATDSVNICPPPVQTSAGVVETRPFEVFMHLNPRKLHQKCKFILV